MNCAPALSGSDRLRFIVAGITTTAFSYLVYATLLLALEPKLAYGLSYAVGIVWAYSMQSVWVFKRAWTWRGLVAFPLVYLAQALISFAVFWALLDRFSAPALLAPLLTIVITIPITYVLGRALINRTSPPAQVDSEESFH